MSHPKLAELIAKKLQDGFSNPGKKETQQLPAFIVLPGMRPTGMPPEMKDQVNAAALVIAEGIIHTIETSGYTITENPTL